MYCVLIGLLMSDCLIGEEGRMVIELTNRWKSGVAFSLFLIKLLAPIIESVSPSTVVLDKVDLKPYLLENGTLDHNKLNEIRQKRYNGKSGKRKTSLFNRI
jgi:hypothetical protein